MQSNFPQKWLCPPNIRPPENQFQTYMSKDSFKIRP